MYCLQSIRNTCVTKITVMKKTVISQCHCGSVELKLYLPNGFKQLRRCNCSICRRKGAIVASVLLDNLIIVKGEEYLTEYRFNTNTAKHYFCSNCGIHTHNRPRSNPNVYGVNIATKATFLYLFLSKILK